jgi:type IV secretion system protein VirB4
MILSTQAVDDFASVDLLRTVVESCPTKLFVANPSFDRSRYAELFQLNETELDLLAGLMPRQQILLKRPRLAKVLNLRVDPQSRWIYSNSPSEGESEPAAVAARARRSMASV